jgi:hypothetical protein
VGLKATRSLACSIISLGSHEIMTGEKNSNTYFVTLLVTHIQTIISGSGLLEIEK